jgi:hypothetical protein
MRRHCKEIERAFRDTFKKAISLILFRPFPTGPSSVELFPSHVRQSLLALFSMIDYKNSIHIQRKKALHQKPRRNLHYASKPFSSRFHTFFWGKFHSHQPQTFEVDKCYFFNNYLDNKLPYRFLFECGEPPFEIVSPETI